MSQPKITITGEAAVNSDKPIYVLTLDDCWRANGWKPGTAETRERGKRLIARGYGYATWIYGIEGDEG